MSEGKLKLMSVWSVPDVCRECTNSSNLVSWRQGQCNTLNTFKKHLKTHLFTSSFTLPDWPVTKRLWSSALWCYINVCIIIIIIIIIIITWRNDGWQLDIWCSLAEYHTSGCAVSIWANWLIDWLDEWLLFINMISQYLQESQIYTLHSNSIWWEFDTYLFYLYYLYFFPEKNMQNSICA